MSRLKPHLVFVHLSFKFKYSQSTAVWQESQQVLLCCYLKWQSKKTNLGNDRRLIPCATQQISKGLHQCYDDPHFIFFHAKNLAMQGSSNAKTSSLILSRSIFKTSDLDYFQPVGMSLSCVLSGGGSCRWGLSVMKARFNLQKRQFYNKR